MAINWSIPQTHFIWGRDNVKRRNQKCPLRSSSCNVSWGMSCNWHGAQSLPHSIPCSHHAKTSCSQKNVFPFSNRPVPIFFFQEVFPSLKWCPYFPKRPQVIWSTKNRIHPAGRFFTKSGHEKNQKWPSYDSDVVFHMKSMEIPSKSLEINWRQLKSIYVNLTILLQPAWTFPWRQAQLGVRNPHQWLCGWSPSVNHFERIFHCKPSSYWGSPIWGKPPYFNHNSLNHWIKNNNNDKKAVTKASRR